MPQLRYAPLRSARSEPTRCARSSGRHCVSTANVCVSQRKAQLARVPWPKKKGSQKPSAERVSKTQSVHDVRGDIEINLQSTSVCCSSDRDFGPSCPVRKPTNAPPPTNAHARSHRRKSDSERHTRDGKRCAGAFGGAAGRPPARPGGAWWWCREGSVGGVSDRRPPACVVLRGRARLDWQGVIHHTSSSHGGATERRAGRAPRRVSPHAAPPNMPRVWHEAVTAGSGSGLRLTLPLLSHRRPYASNHPPAPIRATHGPPDRHHLCAPPPFPCCPCVACVACVPCCPGWGPSTGGACRPGWTCSRR